MEKTYERALSNEKKEDDGNLGRSVKRLARPERSWSFIVQNQIRITMDKIARAVFVSVSRSSVASSALGTVNTLKVSTIEICFSLVREVAVEWDRNGLDTKP